MLGHTTNIFNPMRTGGALNANSRGWRSGLGQKGAGLPLCLLFCRAGRSGGREWHQGDTDTLCRGLHRGNTTFISSMCGEKKSLSSPRLKFPGGTQGQEEIILLSHCPEWHRQVPSQNERAHRWTDRQPPSQSASAWEGGVLASQGRWGEFQLLQYTNKFQQSSISQHFLISLSEWQIQLDRQKFRQMCCKKLSSGEDGGL